jgi:hypothetical protein
MLNSARSEDRSIDQQRCGLDGHHTVAVIQAAKTSSASSMT